MFELGYYIEKDRLGTHEGAEEYVRMSQWANAHSYVIKEKLLDVSSKSMESGDNPEYTYPIWVYVICESDKPAEPTKVEQLEQEMAQCKQWFRREGGHDDMCAKCYALHLDFQQEYPDLFAEGIEKRKRINEIEREIALYS